jgi:SRR1
MNSDETWTLVTKHSAKRLPKKVANLNIEKEKVRVSKIDSTGVSKHSDFSNVYTARVNEKLLEVSANQREVFNKYLRKLNEYAKLIDLFGMMPGIFDSLKSAGFTESSPIRCYALGTLKNTNSLVQFEFYRRLFDHFHGDSAETTSKLSRRHQMYVIDPYFDQEDLDFLALWGLNASSNIHDHSYSIDTSSAIDSSEKVDDGAHKSPHDHVKTLIYCPHGDSKVNDTVLSSNWTASKLLSLIFIGNSWYWSHKESSLFLLRTEEERNDRRFYSIVSKALCENIPIEVDGQLLYPVEIQLPIPSEKETDYALLRPAFDRTSIHYFTTSAQQSDD